MKRLTESRKFAMEARALCGDDLSRVLLTNPCRTMDDDGTETIGIALVFKNGRVKQSGDRSRELSRLAMKLCGRTGAVVSTMTFEENGRGDDESLRDIWLRRRPNDEWSPVDLLGG